MNEPSLFIRLYLDADVQVALAHWLREAGYDCVSARELGHETLTDEAILTWAAVANRVVLTFNIHDYVDLVREWWFANRPHASVVGSKQLPIGELQQRVLRLLNSVTPEEISNCYRNLGEFAERG